MMRPPNQLPEVFLSVAPIDFRLQINGLAIRVQESLGLNPLSEHHYVFTNRRHNRIKILALAGAGTEPDHRTGSG